jgi:hypothetical protein
MNYVKILLSGLRKHKRKQKDLDTFFVDKFNKIKAKSSITKNRFYELLANTLDELHCELKGKASQEIQKLIKLDLKDEFQINQRKNRINELKELENVFIRSTDYLDDHPFLIDLNDIVSLKDALDKAENDIEKSSEHVKDYRILLIEFKSIQNNKTTSHIYNKLISSLSKEGFMPVDFENIKYKVYPEFLCYLFGNDDEIEAKRIDTNEVFVLDSTPYWKSYMSSYLEGQQYFKENYAFSKNVLFGENSKSIISVFNKAYSGTLFKNKFIGWNGVRSLNTFMITHKLINEYGYYSGVLSQADEYKKLYPSLFEALNKTELADKSDTIKEKGNLTINQIALIYVYNKIQVTRINANSIIKKYSLTSGEKLFQRYTFYSSLSNRKGKPNNSTPKKIDNKILLFEGISKDIKPEYFEGFKRDLNTLKSYVEYDD